MRELIDIVTLYMALGGGMIALWFGVLHGYDLGSSVIRALWCCFLALAIGMAAKALWFIASAVGRERRDEQPEMDKGESESELQGR